MNDQSAPVNLSHTHKISDKEKVIEGLRNFLRYIGEDPTREGLIETPDRFIRSFKEKVRGNNENPKDYLLKVFDEVSEYDDIVILKGISFSSTCEHHLLPIIGRATVAYYPEKRVVGISKLARVVDAFAHRLQIQERMTADIANCIQESLQPKGVAVYIEAVHQCMSSRGVLKEASTMVTTKFTGIFEKDEGLRRNFVLLVKNEEVSESNLG